MAVLRLVPKSHADTIAVFKCLLERAIAGEIDGSEVVVRTLDGEEEIFFTGLYHHKPAEAANAAMRVCWRLAQEQDSKSSSSRY